MYLIRLTEGSIGLLGLLGVGDRSYANFTGSQPSPSASIVVKISGEGGGRVTYYIWHSTDVRAEMVPFSSAARYMTDPFFFNKKYMNDPIFLDSYVKGPIFF